MEFRTRSFDVYAKNINEYLGLREDVYVDIEKFPTDTFIDWRAIPVLGKEGLSAIHGHADKCCIWINFSIYLDDLGTIDTLRLTKEFDCYDDGDRLFGSICANHQTYEMIFNQVYDFGMQPCEVYVDLTKQKITIE